MDILQSCYAPRGGGGRSIPSIFCYVDLDQASTVYPHPPKNYQASPQKSLKVSNPPPPQKKKKKKKNLILYLDLKKKPLNV